MQSLLTAPRPEFLATVEERQLGEQLGRIEQSLAEDNSPQAADLRVRTQRLRGLLTWSVRTAYHDRLTEFGKHLNELDSAMDYPARFATFINSRNKLHDTQARMLKPLENSNSNRLCQAMQILHP